MSFQITTAFVQQYKSNVQLLSQQMGSRLRGSCRVESVQAEFAFFEQIGAVTAQLKISRHGDTPQYDTPHARRRVGLNDYEWADLVPFIPDRGTSFFPFRQPSGRQDTKWLIFFWYHLNGRIVTNPYLAKLYTLWDFMIHRRTNGAVVLVTMSIP